jgi:hypothetical protein
MPGGRRIVSAGVTDAAETQRLRRRWDRHAVAYDSQISRSERRFFQDTRRWVCGRATGQVLEVAIGTGSTCRTTPTASG